MLAAYTELKNAQKVKEVLIKKKILHTDYEPVKELDRIYFPVTKRIPVANAKVVDTKFSFPKREMAVTLNDLLKGKLTVKEMALIPKTQEIVGDILILEIPDELQHKEKIIAEAYLAYHKTIATVVKKTDMHSGVFRTRKVRILAGKKKKETVHRENGVQMKIHLEKMYFSPRLANERLRIAKQITKSEEVLVMFSGAGPYPLVIARNSPVEKIYGIEINVLAHQYALENIPLNHLEDKIVVHEGDVMSILPQLRKKFDRIVMPLPKTGEDFLHLALQKAKKGAIVHLYAFLHENEVQPHKKKIKKISTLSKHPVQILRTVPCGQFSPGVHRYCFDLKVM